MPLPFSLLLLLLPLSSSLPSSPPSPPSRASFDSLCSSHGPLVCDYLYSSAIDAGLDPSAYYTDTITAPQSSDAPVLMPRCAWRSTYSQLLSSTTSAATTPWNIAFPDQNSIYHMSLM